MKPGSGTGLPTHPGSLEQTHPGPARRRTSRWPGHPPAIGAGRAVCAPASRSRTILPGTRHDIAMKNAAQHRPSGQTVPPDPKASTVSRAALPSSPDIGAGEDSTPDQLLPISPSLFNLEKRTSCQTIPPFLAHPALGCYNRGNHHRHRHRLAYQHHPPFSGEKPAVPPPQ
jgi:hypothetical protein